MYAAFFSSFRLWSALLVAVWSTVTFAEQQPLAARITTWLNASSGVSNKYPVVQTVKILTPESRLSTLCAQPELSQAGSSKRLTGNRSVIARCGSKREFIQIAVQAQGTWWTAAHAIKPGAVVLSSDIQPQHGSLEHLPVDILLDPKAIIGQVPTRLIAAGRPISGSQLRKSWAVVSGQTVDVIATGNGFQIRTRGKALDNAAINQRLRLQTPSGRLISGVATADGRVEMKTDE